MKNCQLVMGPAGAGKSTYCSTMITHCQTIKRNAHLVNLDPACESFDYKPTINITDLISLDDVMEELQFGPNGGLIYCLEHVIENMDWLQEQLQDYEDDYLIIDCPGQIELFTHHNIMRRIVNELVCGVYLLDSQFVEDTPKFFQGVMTCMSAMLQLEIPHLNVLSKMDLCANPENILRFLDSDTSLLLETANKSMAPKYANLNAALVRLIDEYSMVHFLPLNIKDEDSVEKILYEIDNALQYFEDQEPKEPKDDEYDFDNE